MAFAWKVKNNFLSTSSMVWARRGRPKRVKDCIMHVGDNHINDINDVQSQNDQLLSDVKAELANICKNLSAIHSRKLITDDEFNAGCMYNIIAYNAFRPMMPRSCPIAQKYLFASCDEISSETIVERSHRHEENQSDRALKKYLHIKKLLVQKNPHIDQIIEIFVIKDINLKLDARYNAARNDLSLLKIGLNIIHNYFSAMYSKAMIENNDLKSINR